MKIGAVIIARYNSSRLFGKVLRDLNGSPAIEHTYERLSQVLSNDQIIIATSNETYDDPIEDFANSKGWNVYRGSLENVSERFLNAGLSMNWDYLIRINGDNIFIDLSCIQEMINVAEEDQHDFLSNVKDRTFPKGMSIEIVRAKFYKKHLFEISNSDYYKEHVTIALYENNWGKHKYFYNTSIQELQGIQLALDTLEDFNRIEKLIKALGNKYPYYNLNDIKHAYEQLER